MERKKKSLFVSLVITIVAMFAVIFIFSGLVWQKWTPERVKHANEGITYSSNGSSLITVSRGNYDFSRYGFRYDVVINLDIYNSTEYELDEVSFTVYYEYDGRSKIGHVDVANLQPGKTTLDNINIDTFYDTFGYSLEDDNDFSMYYSITDDEFERTDVYTCANVYTDPENPPEDFNVLFCLIIIVASLILFVSSILLVINIISAIRNRFLVEYVSTSFIEETNEVPAEEVEIIGPQKLHCEYCGNEFINPYEKCPCCGARLKNKRHKRKAQ